MTIWVRFALGLFVAIAAAPTSWAADDPLLSIQERMRTLAAKTDSSVVRIVVSTVVDASQTKEDLAKGTLGGAPAVPVKFDLAKPSNIKNYPSGAGIVISDKGLILTPYHLIEGATKIYIHTNDGRGSYANIHAADARSDLAVLKILDLPPRGVKPISLGLVRGYDLKGKKATLRKGDFVVSVGPPMPTDTNMEGTRIQWGLVSDLRQRQVANDTINDKLQRPFYRANCLIRTDIRSTHNTSGCAILNLDGELIGISSTIVSVVGGETSGGFAIPMDMNYRSILNVLMEGREVEYGFLGVTSDLGPDGRGVAITNVTPGTPAANAGLLGGASNGFNRFRGPNGYGDIVLAVNGQPLRDQADLFFTVGSSLANSQATLTVLRDSSSIEMKVKLAKFNNTLPWIASNQPQPVFGLRVDYASIYLQGLIGAQDRGVFNAPVPEGVVVRDLVPASAAEAAFKTGGEDLTRNWIIVTANGQPVPTPGDFERVTKDAQRVSLKLVHSLEPSKTRTITLGPK